MPKLTPIHIKRNSEIRKRFNELFVAGMLKRFVVEQIANEYFLTPSVIARIIQPVKYGQRGGKIKSEKQYKEFVRAYNVEYRKVRRHKLMKSIELKIKQNED